MRLFPIVIIAAAALIALTIFQGGAPLNRAPAGEPTPVPHPPTPSPEITRSASLRGASRKIISGEGEQLTPLSNRQPLVDWRGAGGEATPDLTAVPDLILTLTWNRLDKPVPMSNPPSQIDKGAVYYWLVCIPCHGDRGQGLTEEWREVFGPDEQNCWQSKCHAGNHPPEGFSLPRAVPPVLGPGTLQRYQTGAELYHIIQTSMPWYNPDFITADDEWNVTAYLLWKQGVLPRDVTIDASNIAAFRLGTLAPSKDEERPLTFALIGLLAVIVIGLAWQGRRP